MSEDSEIDKCIYGCREAFLSLHTNLGTEIAQVQSRKHGKGSYN